MPEVGFLVGSQNGARRGDEIGDVEEKRRIGMGFWAKRTEGRAAGTWMGLYYCTWYDIDLEFRCESAVIIKIRLIIRGIGSEGWVLRLPAGEMESVSFLAWIY
jgi:hypothetical protein